MSEDGLTANSVETQKDIGLTPKDKVRRWLLEIKLSEKGEEKWRRTGSKIYDRYRGADKRKNSFNILWSNTETLRPAVYSSPPKADVRRRYRDADPIGKAVSESLTRSLDFSIDSYDLHACLQDDVLDALLPGRGVSRIRYVPNINQVGGDNEKDGEPHESGQGEQVEELEWEQAVCEHVNWQDFRRGQGRTWGEVQWIAFRHRLTRDQLIEKFGKIGGKIEITGAKDEDIKSLRDKDPVKDLFNTGEVWEVWDKESREVLFVSQGYPDAPCKVDPDPLGLKDFFPIPRPLQFIQDTDKLVPIPLFTLYEEQANELDNAAARRNKIVDALKFRGVYDATLTEMSEVMKGNDNDLIPVKNASAFIERGGLDKMIWVMPVEQAARVLVELDKSIEASKQAIYEIAGIGDIIRASTDPNETASAQKLKSQWGSMRLQKMQREVQRYARDLIRLMSEVIGGKFQLETLKAMTGLPYLTAQEWQAQSAQAMAQGQQQFRQAAMQWQQAAQQAQAQGQPPPPKPQPPQPPPKPVLWEDIIGVLRDSGMRSYHVDIETDSTVADQVAGDTQGLSELMSGITQFVVGILPAVGAGMVPVETVKETVLTLTRRARLGNAVEDAWEKLQPPQPPPDPNAGKVQAKMQEIQAKSQADAADRQQELQFKQMEMRQEMQLEQFRQQMQAAQVQHQNALEAQRAELDKRNEAALEQMRIAADARTKALESQVEVLVAHMGNVNRLEVAEIGAKTTLEAAQISAAKSAEGQE